VAYYHFPLSRTVIINNAVEVPAVDLSHSVRINQPFRFLLLLQDCRKKKGSTGLSGRWQTEQAFSVS
jgi:hypothetical protein